jgi:hypothetical protein
MYEKGFHGTNKRKTLPKAINFNMFTYNSGSISLVATCANCGVYWSAYDSLDMLQKVMIEAGVLV